jgi:hypothetical protein
MTLTQPQPLPTSDLPRPTPTPQAMRRFCAPSKRTGCWVVVAIFTSPLVWCCWLLWGDSSPPVCFLASRGGSWL